MPANILFVFADQHRFNALGCMGNPVVQTPNLDRLASEGAVFENVWCQSPVCQPSRASVITGRYPHQIELTANFQKDLDPDWPNAMKQLQAVGYETATFGKTHYMSPGRDLARQAGSEGYDLDLTNDFISSFGWDHVMQEYDRYMHISPVFRTPYMRHLDDANLLDSYQAQIRSVNRLTPDHWRAETGVLPQEHDLTSFIADRTMAWLDGGRDASKPFFAKVGFVQPHVPLIDDPVWAARYADADVRIPDQTFPEDANPVWKTYVDFLKNHSQVQTMDEAFVGNGIRHYYGMVSLIDQKVGEIVSLLARTGELERTWIVYGADHGEMLGEHHLWAKHNFYRGSVQTPLIIRPPAEGDGRVIDDLVEMTDISATLTDIAGASPVPGGAGRSLIPALRGGRVAREFVHSMIGNRPSNYLFAAMRNRQYRLTVEVTTQTPCELFDLQGDPGETRNLVNDPGFETLIGELRADVLDPHLANKGATVTPRK